MRVSVFGLGYVGSVSAACLANVGHVVTGMDIDNSKVAAMNDGRSPVVEPHLDALISEGVANGNLRATTSALDAVSSSDVLLACVNTPSNSDGSLRLDAVAHVCKDIGAALGNLDGYRVVVIRSTVLPRAVDRLISILETSSGKRAGCDFGFATNPEFLREASAVRDFRQPPFTVIGELDSRSGEAVASLYSNESAPVFRVSPAAAQMVKYASNAFHALKVVFANEIGRFCADQQIDALRVMEIFAADTKLNISPSYLRPGFAFGGACLEKDLSALLHSAHELDLSLPVLEAILPSNELQIQQALDRILATGSSRIGIVGLSNKQGISDVRGSPVVKLADQLACMGLDVSVYDHDIAAGSASHQDPSANDGSIAPIGSLRHVSLENLMDVSEVVVIPKSLPDGYQTRLWELVRPDHTVIDLR
ncbi:MAG: nucleotide sugar dehydrogenase [Chloroflexi bacterium]|nr:nucleotide sugar dehydrogenase [Chloroflexota bacterium]